MNKRIVEIRKSAGLTQEQFALKMGISKNYVNLIENGKKQPGNRLISDICQVFQINEIWLRTGSGTPNISKTGAFSALLSDLEDSNDEFIKDFIEVYMQLDSDSKKALRKLAKCMAEKYKEQD